MKSFLLRIIVVFKIILVLLVQNLHGQNPVKKFEEYQNSHHLEKVYVNHDKPFYLLGDTIWCQAVFVEGRTHQFFNASPIVYVDWINSEGELVDNYLLKIDQGLANFEIPTRYTDRSGEYVLRAYTQYQRNFEQDYLFQKNIQIFSDSLITETRKVKRTDNFEVRFYPEGGEIISSLNNKVAVKVQNTAGDNIAFTAVLADGDDNEIMTFKSYNEGIGFFEFIPEAGKDYLAKVRCNGIEKSFEIPKALNEGYTININGFTKDHIVITLASNKKKLLKDALIVGHVRGQVFLKQELKKVASQQLKIPRDQVPSGILHFTLFDDKDRPVSERLSFNKNPNERVDVTVNLSKPYFAQRDKIEFDISPSVTDRIVPSSLSVSVFNKDVIPTGTNDLSIVNYLLLQSDLKGRINNLNQYFLKDDSRTNFLIDLLMLTHGWRRFTWQDILKEEMPSMEFATAEDIPIIGVVRKRKKDQPVKADVFLSILSKSDFSSTNITTEEDGIFYFKGFEFQDSKYS